jgi:hypothetical protein
VGPRAGLDAGARRKILCSCRGSNPDRPARSQTLYRLSYRGLGTMVADRNCNQEEMKGISNFDNGSYHALQNLFTFTAVTVSEC